MAHAFLVYDNDPLDGSYARKRSPRHSKSKRIVDISVAVSMLLLFLPVICVLYVLVRLDGGPGFFCHERIGACCKPFRCIKFRTMVRNSDLVLAEALAKDSGLAAEWENTHKLRNDPRVTKIGRFLRKTSLDEIPQVFNVLRSDMSVVGPRPITFVETQKYGAHISDYYAALPGITGLWQVSGRSETSYERRVELDVQYVTEWSLLNDIWILLKTVPVVFLRQGAH